VICPETHQGGFRPPGEASGGQGRTPEPT
jgi:hypothetical protein